MRVALRRARSPKRVHPEVDGHDGGVRVVVMIAAGGVFAVAAVHGGRAATGSITWRGFQTPSHNIVCNGARSRIDCVVFSLSQTCQQTWSLRVDGVARHRCLFANICTEVPVLGYGATVRSGLGMRCASRRRGLTCSNRRHHGFFLSRTSQRIF